MEKGLNKIRDSIKKAVTVLWKILKSKWLVGLYNSIIAGIIAGVLVTYLLAVPKIAVQGIKPVWIDRAKDYQMLEFKFENKGGSPAKSTRWEFVVGAYGDDLKNFKHIKQPLSKVPVEVGGLFYDNVEIKKLKGRICRLF